MDEKILYRMRRDPPPEFAQKLRASLERGSPVAAVSAGPRKTARAAAIAGSVALVAFALTFPSVRAAAQAFLDLFRVVNFAPVSVNVDQLKQLQGGALDLPHMLGEQVQVVKEPGPPVSYPTAGAAGSAAGFHVRLPAWTPVGWELGNAVVLGEREVRVTASTDKLKQVLDALQIDDLSIPDRLNGQSATVHVAPAVAVTYRKAGQEGHMVNLVQARSPDVSFPAGMDLAALGEIGLRILGVDRAQAHRFAQNIDWRTTLIVPVPADAASFRQVDVQGNPGLLIETAAPQPAATETAGRGKRHGGNVLLWSAGGQVFAMRGTLDAAQLLEMAQTLQ